ncbi:MAG: PKD domain-containing protein, partial [Bacteroidia bacterium]
MTFSLQGNLPPGVSGYSWAINGSPFSSLASPGRVFQTAGNYNITVQLLFSGAPSQTIGMAAPIVIFEGPQADFTVQPTMVCRSAPVNFSDLSIQGSSPIASWQWSFGDGSVDNSQNPVKRYSQAGTYGISLSVTDINGCVGTAFIPQLVTVNWPDASFNGTPTTACNQPLFSTFRALGTGPGTTHQWNFGNGRLGFGATATGNYNFRGSFTVTHIITDQIGCSDTLVIPNMVNVGNNLAKIIASDTVICPGDTIFLDCNSTSAIATLWDINGGSSTACSEIFTSRNPGNYRITLINTEPGPCFTYDTLDVRVRPLPQVNFTYSPDPAFSCDPPLAVQFTNATQSPPGTVYRWLFGDGSNPSNQTSPSHTYLARGSYSVTLQATDPFGCSSSQSQFDIIKVGGVTAGLSADSLKGCKPLGVNFMDGSVLGPSGPIVSYHWDFGNGDTAIIANPRATYLDTGFYDVKLIVEDSLGCIDSISRRIAVGDTVKADFEIVDSIACVRQEVYLFNRSTGNYNASVWDIGGITYLNQKDPKFAFQDTGWYFIELIVEDRGCYDTLRKDSAFHILPPKAGFDGNLVGCDTPHTVFFRDTSIGATRYFWDFGTGNPGDTSNIAEPIFTYRQTGFYNVMMVVWNDATGCADTVISTVSVEIFRMQIAATPRSGCVPQTVQFTDQGTGGALWNWDFGDGNRSIRQNPQHTYNQAGTFTASLAMYSAGSCAGTRTIRIDVYQPNVTFGALDTNACIGDLVTFTNSTFTPLTITNWLWDFGDGTSSTLQNPTHRYNRTGDFTVTLTATDSRGCVGTISKRRFILVTKPTASYQPQFPATCIGRPLRFTDRSSGVSTLNYQWYFGDRGGSFSSGNQTHTYVQDGRYTTQLIVTDSLGCSDTLQSIVVVEDPDITVSASLTSINCPPLLTNFTATINSAHQFTRWQWDFGDGNGANVQNPTHQYTLPGTYTVFVIATSASGCQDTFFLPNTITVLGPSGTFDIQPLVGCEDLLVSGNTQLTNTVSNAIDFDDGTVLSGSPILNTFSHVYTRPGVFHPVMILDDGLGCRLSVPIADSVIVLEKPSADFRPSLAALCDTGTLQFVDRSTSGIPLVSWDWNFGDNTTSMVQNPAHFYNGPGTYNVQLIVTTNEGCRDTALAQTAVIVHPLPQAGLRLSGVAGCTPYYVEAFDASPPGNAPIVDWEWDFGVPGGTDRQQNSSFIYTTPGVYRITLAVTDANGYISVKDTTIEAWPTPQADFVT